MHTNCGGLIIRSLLRDRELKYAEYDVVAVVCAEMNGRIIGDLVCVHVCVLYTFVRYE